MRVETRQERTAYRPGEEIEGTASWDLDAQPQVVELRLFWYTRGKGDQDVGLVETVVLEPAQRAEGREFRVRLPSGPYSFSGKLISLVWAIELEAVPAGAVGRLEIVVSPTGREILLPPAAAGREDARPR